ncbi:MAG: tRNA pseudouridine(55) synthase TruB [Alphaproteobacteria bacterium]|nr:tRNA pseudouridine(55) synthase TruB [Alphaproteobacteria bacterium]
MARTRKGDKVDGWLILDKPAGLSSAGAVAAIKRLFNAAKVGHAGTLDPLATGVLPIALGEATKTVSFVQDGAKAYRFTLRWGEARDTDDAEGAVIATSETRPDETAIRAALPSFTGEIEQRPPAYSALKRDGKPAYARARAGEAVDLAPRRVRIDGFELESQPDRDSAVFQVRCGKGTYIRSLARDLASLLGTVGYVAELRRLRVGRFMAETAISLEKLTSLGHSPARFSHLRPVETALDDIPALAITEADSLRLRQGQAVQVRRAAHEQGPEPPRLALATAKGRPVALVRIEPDAEHLLVRPTRVLNLG